MPWVRDFFDDVFTKTWFNDANDEDYNFDEPGWNIVDRMNDAHQQRRWEEAHKECEDMWKDWSAGCKSLTRDDEVKFMRWCMKKKGFPGAF